MKLTEYILQPRSVRIAHIDLSTPCDPQGRKAQNNKRAVLDFLGVVNDLPNWKTGGVERCHLCDCDSSNGWCANPLHVYIGTASENTLDFNRSNPSHPRANGSAPYYDPTTGECRLMSREEAESLGWVGVNAGKGAYLNPETGERRWMIREEADALGWVGVYAGKGAYLNPETDERQWMTREEAEALGWVSVNAGKKHQVVTCPYCGKEGGVTNMKRYHFDNCDQRKGSWRWFKAQLKQWERSRTESLLT